jgi:predicted metal-dependent hydrolase
MRRRLEPNQKTLEHAEIGTVLFKKNPRSKRITLKVKRDGTVIVTLPKSVAYKAAEPILHQNIDWVKKQLEKARANQETKLLSYNSTFQIRDKVLCILPHDRERLIVYSDKDKIEILVPRTWDLSSKEVQDQLQYTVIETLRQEAKSYLPKHTQDLADQKGVLINDIRIKKVKTRWGSCSSKSNINLSLYLMLLPDELIDYVILHELAHIKHQNHSAAFWNHLEGLLPGSKQLDKTLNAYRIPFL